MSDMEKIEKIVRNGLKGYGAVQGAIAAGPAAGAAYAAGITIALAVPAAPVTMALSVLGAGAFVGWTCGSWAVKELFGPK